MSEQDELNKALYKELIHLIGQAHGVVTEKDVTDQTKQAMFSFGNYIAARAHARLSAIQDEAFRAESAEVEADLTRLAEIHLNSFTLDKKPEAQGDAD